tara:strand:- start:461 stop:784 length:324 start_codon:yes stop_codon:yes gene_type:complete
MAVSDSTNHAALIALLMKLDIPEDRATTYADSFVENGVDTPEALMELEDEELKVDLGIKMLGDRAKIRSLAENYQEILTELYAEGGEGMTQSSWGTPSMTEEERYVI